MSQKREYDSLLGGNVMLENHVQTYRYAASVLQEIKEIVAATKQTSNNSKLIFQTLPKHIRRRAMSHHPKRLPRKYRSIHIAQMAKSGDQRISNRPSRKYRRRPKNLLLDYVRRQRRHVWLETHIWHARRFHMIERWGYRLARNSCDKTFRACYRATADHCLVQDISFYVCLELQGTLSSILIGLTELSNNCQTTSNGLTIKAKTYLGGRREGFIDFFRKGCYPEGALCRASFMWRPDTEAGDNEENLQRTLWLWVHPCAYPALLEELKNVFGLEREVVGEDADETEANAQPLPKGKAAKDVRLKFMTKNLAHTRIQRYTNAAGGVTLTDLKDTLNRFRLTGPLSQSVLAHAFKVKCEAGDNSKDTNESWFGRRLQETKFRENHENQAKYWKRCEHLSTPAALMSNMILALNIIDPRLQRPAKRTKALPQLGHGDTQTNLFELLVNQPKALADSALWDLGTRQQLREQMMDTQTWCQLREKHALVPGAACAFEEQMQPLPVLLIQRPGSSDKQKRLSYGCGWDVIAPAGYGMPIWLTCIMWGAKAGGLRELRTVAREMGTELQLPDTVGGHERAEQRYNELYDRYFRLPPGKRSNYRKLAIASPFRAPWQQLVRDWMPSQVEKSGIGFFVLREHEKLSNLHEVLHRLKDFPTAPALVPPPAALIQVQLRMKTRGNIGKMALICLPTKRDIKTHFKRFLRQTHDAIHLEPLQPDLNAKERKIARTEHKKKLKRLRARRLREKRKLQETSTTRVRIRAANTETLISAHAERMRSLWLPDEECNTLLSVRKQCSRETFGYVTEASFAFTAATVCAVGYTTTEGLKRLLDNCRGQRLKSPMCLVRDTNSQQYYFATIAISLHP